MSEVTLVAKHSFGCGPRCRQINVLAVPDEDGETKEHILHSVGQQVALSRIEDGKMKFLTLQSRAVREVFAIATAPAKRLVAVSESIGSTRANSDSTNVRHKRIALYHLYSKTPPRILSIPAAPSHFTCIEFSPDASHLAGVTSSENHANGSQPQQLAIWLMESDSLHTVAAIPSGQVTHLRTFVLSCGTLCLTTSGKQHFKLWNLSEQGLKVHSVLSSSQEGLGNFIDHVWSPIQRKEVVEPLLSNGHGVKPGLGHGVRLLLLANNGHAKLDASVNGGGPGVAKDDAHVANVLILGTLHCHPYLEFLGNKDVSRPGIHLKALVAHMHGFCIAGSNGYFAAFESRADSESHYTLVCSFFVTNYHPDSAAPSWAHLCISCDGQTLVAHAEDRSLYSFPLGELNWEVSEVSDPQRGLSEGGLKALFVPLTTGNGVPHHGEILSMDTCIYRPLIATCGTDHTVRVWKYARRNCEIIYHGGRTSEPPCCLALHPSGFQIIVGYPECMRVFSVLFRNLKLLHSLSSVVKCHDLQYAHGGHRFACAAGITVKLYSAISMALLNTLTGHISPIRCIIWAMDDLSLFSAGTNGNVYGWDLVNVLRIEEASQLNHTATYNSLAAHLPLRGVSTSDLSRQTNSRACVVAASDEGFLKEVSWNFLSGDNVQARNIAEKEQFQGSFTALASAEQLLFAGSSAGTICVFDWPTEASDNSDMLTHKKNEFPFHLGAVSALRTTCEYDVAYLFSAGEDGIIFVSAVQPSQGGELEKRLDITACNGPDTVQVSLQEWEENANAMAALTKQLDIQKNEYAFALHRKDLDCESQVKLVREKYEALLTAESARLADLRTHHEKGIQECRADAARKGSHSIQVTHDLENQYEHKLALEMERYDRLSEEIESIQQRCEGLLEAQQREHEGAIQHAESCVKRVEKELHQQIDRLHEDAKHNEQMFREVLDQQEHEYETELQKLMIAAQTELTAERENTAEARGSVQTRNTKISRLEKRMDELKTSSHARNVLLTAEKVRNAKLEATLRHFKRHMEERESTLEDKELSILRLRRKNVTLDNFRFVLDHRLQQLMEERGPIARHVKGLEAHITAMYDELECEYYKMKVQEKQLDSNELKMHTLSRESTILRSLLRERDTYIASFKRELATAVSFTTPKELEDAIKEMYHRFVKEEAPRNKVKALTTTATAPKLCAETEIITNENCSISMGRAVPGEKQQNLLLDLKDALIEAHSQRNCVQQNASNLKHRLDIAKSDAERQQRVKLGENFQLIAECNQLRGEQQLLSREVNHLRQVVKDYNNAIKKRRDKCRDRLKAEQKTIPAANERKVTCMDKRGQTPPQSIIPKFMTLGGKSGTSTMSHRTIDSAWRGSTRDLSLRSAQDAQFVQMMNQLDENSRTIGTQKMEIHHLRAQMQRYRSGDIKKREPPASVITETVASCEISSNAHVHLGLFPNKL